MKYFLVHTARSMFRVFEFLCVRVRMVGCLWYIVHPLFIFSWGVANVIWHATLSSRSQYSVINIIKHNHHHRNHNCQHRALMPWCRFHGMRSGTCRRWRQRHCQQTNGVSDCTNKTPRKFKPEWFGCCLGGCWIVLCLFAIYCCWYSYG